MGLIRSKPCRILSLGILLSASAAFAVSTSQWAQTTEADFRDGTFENVVATNLGDLKLSRAVQLLMETDPMVSAVNALAEAPDGTIFAGTSPRGVLLEVKGDSVKQLLTLEEDANIFALAIDRNGRLLIGTGGEAGRVLRLDKLDGKTKPTEIFKAEGVQYVWAIRQTPDGNLYVGTGPTGQLYEITPDGKSRVLFDAKDNNILSLITDGKNVLYAGTDPSGLVYRIDRMTGDSFVLYDAVESEISALALDARGNLYAGTAEARDEQGAAIPPGAGAGDPGGRPEGTRTGVPLPSEPPPEPDPPKLPDPTPGQPDPIPKATSHNHRGAAPNTDDRLANARGPSDAIALADDPSGSAPPAGDENPAPPTEPPPGGEPTPPQGDQPNPPAPPPGSEPAPNPAPGAATDPNAIPGRQPPVDARTAGQPRPEGNAIYRIDPDGFVSEIFRQPVLVLSIVERGGTLLVATGSNTEGNIYQVNPAAEETIILAKVNPKQILSLLPAKDGRVYLGLANVGGVAWMSPGFAVSGTYTSTVLDAQQISRFGKMQLRGLLPEGSTLTIATRSGNVKDPASEGWSKWSADVPAAEFIPVEAPSARFLQYRLTLNSAAAKATPIVEDVTIAYQVPNLPPQVRSVRLSAAPDNAQPNAAGGAEAEPTRIASARRQTIAWEAADPNGDQITYALHFRRGSNAPWILLKEKVRESQFEWDTRSVADGRYEVKVIATDALSNPPGKGRSASRVSDAIVVDNTPPIIGDIKWRQKGANVTVELKAVDRSSTVAALDFSVDSNRDWQVVLPADSIYDSPDEAVELSLPNLAAGPHQLTLRATDARGNQAFENVLITVDPPAANR